MKLTPTKIYPNIWCFLVHLLRILHLHPEFCNMHFMMVYCKTLPMIKQYKNNVCMMECNYSTWLLRPKSAILSFQHTLMCVLQDSFNNHYNKILYFMNAMNSFDAYLKFLVTRINTYYKFYFYSLFRFCLIF